MRESLVHFGGYPALDTIKHELNNMHRQLIAPTLKLEYRTIQVACEPIFVAEIHDTYAWVVKSMYDISPGAKH